MAAAPEGDIRQAGLTLLRIAVPVGIAAAVVQVVGLLRWPILVPGYASDAASTDAGIAAAARDSFTTAEPERRQRTR